MQTIFEIDTELQKIEPKIEALRLKKDEVDDQIAHVRVQLKEAGARAHTTGVYMDPEQYRALEKRRISLGRESQRLQGEIGAIRKRYRQLKGLRGNLEDQEKMKNFERVADLKERRYLQWEAFFVEAAKQYLSGHEFETICKRATSMQSVRESV